MAIKAHFIFRRRCSKRHEARRLDQPCGPDGRNDRDNAEHSDEIPAISKLEHGLALQSRAHSGAAQNTRGADGYRRFIAELLLSGLKRVKIRQDPISFPALRQRACVLFDPVCDDYRFISPYPREVFERSREAAASLAAFRAFAWRRLLLFFLALFRRAAIFMLLFY